MTDQRKSKSPDFRLLNQQRIPIGPDRFHFRHPGDVLHPEREPEEVLEEIKRTLGSSIFSTQYQQRPVPADGEIVKWDWFQFYDAEPPRQSGDMVVQSWDTASKAGKYNDYSVCTTWLIQGDKYYLLHVLREKLIYPDLKRRVIQHGFDWSPQAIIVEDQGSGTSLIQEIRRENSKPVPNPIPYRPKQDKFTRMYTQSAKIEAGHVFLPKRAPWLEEFRAELMSFPHGPHDDQVDSVSQFLDWGERRKFNVARMVPVIWGHHDRPGFTR
jgi:predicted phage terminase large subunit-like protein